MSMERLTLTGTLVSVRRADKDLDRGRREGDIKSIFVELDTAVESERGLTLYCDDNGLVCPEASPGRRFQAMASFNAGRWQLHGLKITE